MPRRRAHAIVVRRRLERPRGRPRPAAKIQGMCEFRDHRSPPLPLFAAGGRASGQAIVCDRLPSRGLRRRVDFHMSSRWRHPRCGSAEVTKGGTAHGSSGWFLTIRRRRFGRATSVNRHGAPQVNRDGPHVRRDGQGGRHAQRLGTHYACLPGGLRRSRANSRARARPWPRRRLRRGRRSSRPPRLFRNRLRCAPSGW